MFVKHRLITRVNGPSESLKVSNRLRIPQTKTRGQSVKAFLGLNNLGGKSDLNRHDLHHQTQVSLVKWQLRSLKEGTCYNISGLECDSPNIPNNT